MKSHILAITLSALLLLSGCSKSADSGTDTGSADISVQNTKEENSSSADDHIYISCLYNTYKTGFITGTETQMYLDFESMEKTVLCAKPNCTHQSLDCTARIIGETPIIFNDYIYFFDKKSGVNETADGREFYIDTKLKRISLTTSEIEEAAKFTDCSPNEGGGCVISGNMLYFCGDDLNPIADDFGNICSSNAGGKHFICGIDLKTGEYTNYGSIYDGDKQFEEAANSSTSKIIGCYNSKIYIEYSFMKEKISNEEIESKDPREYFTVLNFEFDTASHTLSESSLPPPSYMDSDTYAYSNYPENSSTVIDKGETYTIDGVDVGLFGRVFNCKLFMYDSWYDIADGSEHSLGKYENWEVLTVYDDCYVLISENRNDFVKLTEEELLAL
ncbi:MAG: hypothetical protein ACI4I9_07055 [Porcipelethomonas sp.]